MLHRTKKWRDRWGVSDEPYPIAVAHTVDAQGYVRVGGQRVPSTLVGQRIGHLQHHDTVDVTCPGCHEGHPVPMIVVSEFESAPGFDCLRYYQTVSPDAPIYCSVKCEAKMKEIED